MKHYGSGLVHKVRSLREDHRPVHQEPDQPREPGLWWPDWGNQENLAVILLDLGQHRRNEGDGIGVWRRRTPAPRPSAWPVRRSAKPRGWDPWHSRSSVDCSPERQTSPREDGSISSKSNWATRGWRDHSVGIIQPGKRVSYMHKWSKSQISARS